MTSQGDGKGRIWQPPPPLAILNQNNSTKLHIVDVQKL